MSQLRDIPRDAGRQAPGGKDPDRGGTGADPAAELDSARAELARSEELFRSTFDQAPVGIAHVAPDGRFVRVNREYCSIVGFTPEELLSRSCADITHEEDIAAGIEAHRRMESGEIGSHRTQKRYIRKDGSVVWVNLIIAAVRDPVSGELRYFSAIVEDITARWRARETYRVILSASIDGFLIVDRDRRVLDVNAAYCSLSGYSREELQGMCLRDLEAVEDDVRISARITGILERGWDRFEAKHRRRDGTVVDVEISVRYLESEEGCFICFVRDITERKRAEDALRMSEARLAEAQRIAKLGNWEWEVRGDHVWWSDEAYRIFDIPAGGFDASFDAFIAAVHPDDRERVRRSVRESLAKHEDRWQIEYRVVRRDGTVRHVHEAALNFYDADGVPVRRIGTVQDVTERRLAEMELRASRERLRDLSVHMQSAVEEERRRIGREIHDVLGHGTLLLGMDASRLAEEIPKGNRKGRRILKGMQEQVRALIRGTQRISSALRPVSLDELGLGAAIESQAEEFRKSMGIRCVVQQVPEDVVVEQEQVSTAVFRIFQEALTNVGRHAGATKVTVRLSLTRADVALEVADNGLGLDEDRLSDARSLGLLGMKERARACGGTVDIRGTPGKGTTVTVRIPLGGGESAR